MGAGTAARPGHDGDAARQIITAARLWRELVPGALVLAIDGHGAAGKSTIAAAVAAATDAALVHTDDFFQQPPDRPSSAGQALAGYYDWRAIRTQALEPLRAGRPAAFRRVDWRGGARRGTAIVVRPSDLIVLEGVFSASPELCDLVDRSVLVDTPVPERLRRLRGRVAPQDWDEDWLRAEDRYFGLIRPPSSFALIVAGHSPVAAPPKKGS